MPTPLTSGIDLDKGLSSCIRSVDDSMAPIIGIAGPSCSGKSTLAKALALNLGAESATLDDYYRARSPKILVDGHRSYERPEQYDGAGLARHAIARRDAVPDRAIVLEGFLLFRYPELREIVDVGFFIELAPEAIVARRRTRGGRPSDRSFDAIGIAEWLRFGAGQSTLPNIVTLAGEGSPEALVKAAEEEISRRFPAARRDYDR